MSTYASHRKKKESKTVRERERESKRERVRERESGRKRESGKPIFIVIQQVIPILFCYSNKTYSKIMSTYASDRRKKERERG
jgi:hypothetical protein